MDSLLIDFNSPKLRRGDVPLIPGRLLVPMYAINSVPCCVAVEESNPFDMVDCQVAANYAAENDPFEMVLNDAINCQGSKREEDSVEKSPQLSQVLKEKGRKSLSLPDLRHVSDEEILSQRCKTIVSSWSKENEFAFEKESSVCAPPEESNYANMATCGNSDNAEWDYLDDIPPPDSLLNSTVDMSCFLDETLPSTVCSMRSESMKQETFSNGSEQHFTDTQGLENDKAEEFPQATYKTDEELIMLAQKKIENIITKAKLEVRNDIQDSIIQRRLSAQGPSFPNQVALALCTPTRTRDISLKPSKEMSSSLKEWSRTEMMKLKLIFPESAPNQTRAGVSLLDKVDTNLLSEDFNISYVKMPAGDTTSLPSRSSVSGSELPKNFVAVSPPSSPVLLPLPLCEDAVRNLSLCSKYSPPHPGSKWNNELPALGDIQTVTENVNLDENKQTKLLLRKPTLLSKTNSKMAPMKATAPIQIMTRAKSTSTKPDLNNSSMGAARKPALRESCSKPGPSENTRRFLRMPQSPSRAMSGSLPNLPSQGGKLPTRLPSPRRPSVNLQESKDLKNRLDNGKDKNVHKISGSSPAFHSSPRPERKGSLPSRPGGHSRVLADVNSSTSGRLPSKFRVASNQSDTPRRGRSFLTEKENFL